MFIKTVLLLANLAIALAQINTIINCVQPDLVNYLCIACKPNFQLTAGQCKQCLPGYTLVNGNCISASATTTTTTAQNAQATTTTPNAQTNTQTNTNAATTASQLNSILQIIATNPALADQLKPIVLQLLAMNTAASPTTSPSTIPGLTTAPSTSTSTTTTTSSSSAPKPTPSTATSSPPTSTTTSTSTSTSTASSTPTPPVSSSTTQSTGGSNVFLPFYAQKTVPVGSVTMTTDSSNYARPRPSNTDWNCKRYNQFNMYCAQCYTGFYVNPFTLTCMAVNPNCQNVTSNNLCSSCYQGYTLTNGNCYSTPYNPLSNKCKTIVQGFCQECYTGYYLNLSSNTCQTANPKCKTITVVNKCSSCYQGYLLVNQDCLISDSSNQDWQYTDNNCKNYDNNGLCNQCVNRFVLGQNGGCVMVDPFCQNYTNTGACLLCYIGYQITNGACTLLQNGPKTPSNDWIQCPFRSVPRPGYCLQVSDQCSTWSDVTGLCLTCYTGYELSTDGQCIIP